MACIIFARQTAARCSAVLSGKSEHGQMRPADSIGMDLSEDGIDGQQPDTHEQQVTTMPII